jgi:predicted transposase/invertase (TIGR01784 family)
MKPTFTTAYFPVFSSILVNINQLLELIETIVIYKFPRLSYEEIKTMLNLEEIKQTRVYQDAKEEGKAEGIKQGRLAQKIATISLLQELGLNIEQIAQRLEIEETLVRQHIQ